jgi:histidinol phosphatase-like PHP family hydrolase
LVAISRSTAGPERLDLNDIQAHAAKEADVELAISTDAHSVKCVPVYALRASTGRGGPGWRRMT